MHHLTSFSISDGLSKVVLTSLPSKLTQKENIRVTIKCKAYGSHTNISFIEILRDTTSLYLLHKSEGEVSVTLTTLDEGKEFWCRARLTDHTPYIWESNRIKFNIFKEKGVY